MESIIDQSCPICNYSEGLKLFVHISEIPYFGEHTQMTMMCDSCGWKNTDFIPAEGKKAGSWTMKINTIEHMSVRVVRSSSCTVRIEEIGLEVEPGGNSSGYITNIEGVLNRFRDIVEMILRQAKRDNEENVEKCLLLLEKISEIKKGNKEIEIVLLDPMGHSQILHDDAISRELEKEEITELSVGISIPVFDINSSNDPLE
jgi:zinc finger protein